MMKYFIVILFILLFGTVLLAQKKEVSWLKKEVIDLHIDTNGTLTSNPQALREYIGEAQIVLLGEQTHGDGTAFKTKGQFIKFLHEQLGFEVLVFESSLYLAEKSFQNSKVSDNPIRELRGATYPHWSWTKEVQPLLEYISKSTKSSDPLFVSGMDYQEISKIDREGFPIDLFMALKKLNITFINQDEQNDYFTFYSYLANYFDNLPENIQENELNALSDKFVSTSQRFISQLANHNTADLELLKQALRNKATVAPVLVSRKFTDKDFSTNTRDSIMAENIIWLKEKRYPGKKIIVWAASRHIARNYQPSPEKSVGDYLYQKYKDKMYSIVFMANQGTWGTIGMKNSRDIPPAKEHTLENLFFETGKHDVFLNIRNLNRGSWLLTEQVARPFGYVEEAKVWPNIFDGIIFNTEMVKTNIAQ